jgi:hypothetical protein
MFFRCQLTGEGDAYFAAAGDDDVHKQASQTGEFFPLYHF